MAGALTSGRRSRAVAATLGILAVVATLVHLNVLGFVFRRLGLSEGWALTVLVASVLGGAVNIPVGRLPASWTLPARPALRRSGGLCVLEQAPPRRVFLSANLGGAVIPVVLSAYLVIATSLYLPAAVAVTTVALAVHALARVQPGVGVTVPAFAPALLAAAVTLLLHPAEAVALAYVSGSLGTLAGADLANLPLVARSAPFMITVGGAGSLDGIVLAGAVAVLVVALI